MHSRNRTSLPLTILFALVGLSLLALALLSYGTLKAFTGLLLPDHNFNSLKPWNAGVFKVIFGAGGLIFLVLAALTSLRRWNLVGSFFKQIWVDARRFFAGLRPQRSEYGFLAVVLVIMLLAVIYRLEHIYSSLVHDEAYTYVAFSRSLFTAISDYHLPNNHVFHSILVFFSTQIFGIQPWAVRLPAFVAGVLLVPAVYWLAKRLYDRWTGLAAALLVSLSPSLIGYSTNARGYTLVALFTLLTLSLGDLALKNKNLFVWGLISVLSALGFYTVPVMMIPFGVLFVWLFLENQVSDLEAYRSKWDFLRYWFICGLAAAAITLLLYLPILIYSGPQKLFANEFVTPSPWIGLLDLFNSRFGRTWNQWTTGIPSALIIIFGLGFLLGLVFHRWLSNRRVPLQLAALFWIIVILLVQRPFAGAKLWVFLNALVLLWAAAGTMGLLEKVRLKILRGLPLAAIVFGLALLGGIWQAAHLVPQLPGLWAFRGNEENAVLFAQSQLQESDLIVVAPPDDAPVWYYSELHGIPDASFDTRSLTFERALVLVDTVNGQTPASVIEQRGPESVALDIESARLLDTFGKMQVFEIPRK
jgi:4-amino-4-deoxy-L-arabinose transferase-like glycosyltransferase